MAQLAIKGHPTRGKEVIEILEMLGCRNRHNYISDCDILCYYWNKNTNVIYFDWVNNCYEDKDILIFTLEEFLEKFPYKTGNKVVAFYKGILAQFTIQDMRWNYELNKVEYKICSSWLDPSVIRPYKEENMEENTDKALAPDLRGEDYSGRRFGYKIPNGYEFDCIQNNEIIIKPIKQQYPKTYEECCEIKHSDPNFYIDTHLYSSQLGSLYKLLICRDAYWKIAGEQIGLGKPWTPDWDTEGDIKYVIEVYRNNVRKNSQGYFNTMLAFPTSEMRDAFYDNFKKFIEQCKEFL